MVFLGLNSANSLDIEKALERLLKSYGEILQPGEHLDFAFESKRDHLYLTNHRLILEDAKGVTGTQTMFSFVNYSGVKFFSVETNGNMDKDTKLFIAGVSFRFNKKTVDILKIQSYLGEHIFGSQKTAAFRTQVSDKKHDQEGFFQYLLNHNQVDIRGMQASLDEAGMLLKYEVVELSVRASRDVLVCTNFRFLYIDVKGITGRKLILDSLSWSAIQAYSVKTGGNMELYDKFVLYTNLSPPLVDEITSRWVKGNLEGLFRVLWYFNNKFLGADKHSSAMPQLPAEGEVPESTLNWFTGASAMVDPREVNAHFSISLPVLQQNEVCELAFKGRRDLFLFTTKRIVVVDYQGISKRACVYTSHPWDRIRHFRVVTPGGLDVDSEFGFYTEIGFEMVSNGQGAQVPISGHSYVSLRMARATVDILQIYNYVADKLIPGRTGNSQKPINHLSFAADGGQSDKFTQTLKFLKGIADSLPPSEAQKEFAEILAPSERVDHAYKVGRDLVLFTNKCIISIDRNFFRGKSVEYACIPYSSICNFKCTAGGPHMSDKIGLEMATPWKSSRSFKFARNIDEIFKVYNYLAGYCLQVNVRDGPNRKAADFYMFKLVVGGLLKGASRLPVDHLTKMLSEEFPILLAQEQVYLGFKRRRSLIIVTSLRVLQMDMSLVKKGFFVTSVPLTVITFIELKTSGITSLQKVDELILSNSYLKYSQKIARNETSVAEISQLAADWGKLQAPSIVGISSLQARDPKSRMATSSYSEPLAKK